MRSFTVCGAVVFAIAAAQPTADAGVVLVSQERTLQVRPAPENVGGNPGALDPSEPTVLRTTEAGEFNESLTQNYVEVNGPGRAGGSAAQSSNITGDAFNIVSDVATGSDGPLVEARSLTNIVFDVTRATNFDAFIFFSTQGETQGRPGFDVFELTLREQAPGAPLILVEDREFSELVPNNSTRTESGVLQPGRYQFVVDTLANTVPSEPSEARFDVRLTFSDAGGGGEPNPIPLPPAVWAGAATLAGLAGARGWQAVRSRRTA